MTVDKLGDITELKEYKNGAIPVGPSSGTGRISPPENRVNPARKAQIKERQELRKRLEVEYNILLKRKRGPG